MTIQTLTANQLVKALLILGFDNGWVTTDNEITLWERSEPQPTDEEIFAALHG
jgi:hypothetical protein